MSDSTITSGRRLLGVVAAGFALTALLAAGDLVSDLDEGTTVAHVVVESFIFVVGFVGLTLVVRQLFEASRSARLATAQVEILAGQLSEATAEAERWRSEASDLLRGLSQATAGSIPNDGS